VYSSFYEFSCDIMDKLVQRVTNGFTELKMLVSLISFTYFSCIQFLCVNYILVNFNLKSIIRMGVNTYAKKKTLFKIWKSTCKIYLLGADKWTLLAGVLSQLAAIRVVNCMVMISCNSLVEYAWPLIKEVPNKSLHAQIDIRIAWNVRPPIWIGEPHHNSFGWLSKLNVIVDPDPTASWGLNKCGKWRVLHAKPRRSLITLYVLFDNTNFFVPLLLSLFETKVLAN